MMNEKTINEQYAYIRTLLEEKRLKEALMQLESLLWQCPDWDLRTRLEQLQTSYKYMLEYMKQGANDPDRWNLYQKMVADTWGIADQSRLLMLDNASSRYYHEVRRTPRSADLSNYGIKTILHILESFNDDLAVSGLLSDEKMDEVLRRHEDTLKFMFIRTWTNSAWTPEDEEDAKAMLASELLPGDDLCLFVSALTLSLMECFDIRKIMWLLNAYEHPNVNVSQRALVGTMIIFHIYRSRLSFYPELIKRVDLMEEIPSFREDVARIYRQMLLCQETEKIDKKMREEIIPEMLKNVSSMKNMRFGFEENDEENNDMNPDWEDAFEKSGLGDKLREMNELQLEGADVYMSTFAALKNYPFFREVHNWFYPFSKQQSNVLKAMKQAGNQGGSLLDLILQSGFFSNSDKYSLFFTIHQLPQSQQDMMLSQLNEQQVAELAEKSNVETMKNYPLMTTRIMMKGTTFIEEPLKNIKCDLGIFLDVYPLDNISDDEEELKKQAKAAWFWSKLLILRHVAFPVLPYKGVKAKITHIATAIIHAGLVVFRISHNWIAGKCLKIASRYNDVDTKRMAFLFDTDPYYHIMLKDEIYPLQMYDFEDIKMPLPANEDEKLRNMYGDYMQLPPVEKRKNHYPYKLEFKD